MKTIKKRLHCHQRYDVKLTDCFEWMIDRQIHQLAAELRKGTSRALVQSHLSDNHWQRLLLKFLNGQLLSLVGRPSLHLVAELPKPSAKGHPGLCCIRIPIDRQLKSVLLLMCTRF